MNVRVDMRASAQTSLVVSLGGRSVGRALMTPPLLRCFGSFAGAHTQMRLWWSCRARIPVAVVFSASPFVIFLRSPPSGWKAVFRVTV